MTKAQWLWRRLSSELWVRVALFAAVAVAIALLAAFVPFKVSKSLADSISAKVVEDILTLLAASMLSVTTFSLGIMVSAYASAATTGTPRATRLVMADETTQNVLAVFIGVFIYALVGLVALSLGAYGPSGRVILFFVTILAIVGIVVSLIRWIGRLSHLGRLAHTIERVEAAATEAMRDRASAPSMGALPWPQGGAPQSARAVFARTVGHVQMIDMARLDAAAQKCGARVYVEATPGEFVHPAAPLLRVEGARIDEADWTDAFVVDSSRTFAQDPRFGLIVLAEIASRALSPAVNDPGTAIGVLGRSLRVFTAMLEREAQAPRFARVHARALDPQELLDDVYRPIARDGAGLIEVQLRLQRVLNALHDIAAQRQDGEAIRAAARRLSREAVERAAAQAQNREGEELSRAAAWSARDSR